MTTKSNWHRFGKSANEKTGGGLSPTVTPHLRCVIRESGERVFEQMIEYRNDQGLIVGNEWVVIPVIYEMEMKQ